MGKSVENCILEFAKPKSWRKSEAKHFVFISMQQFTIGLIVSVRPYLSSIIAISSRNSWKI